MLERQSGRDYSTLMTDCMSAYVHMASLDASAFSYNGCITDRHERDPAAAELPPANQTSI